MKVFIPVITAVSVLLAGCKSLNVGGVDIGALAGAGKSLVQSGRQISDDEERMVGEAASGQLLAERAVLDAPVTQQYVNRVGTWLALHSERPELDWHFAVLDSDEINAWAAPGGYVFITRGMLSLMDSEAELAGVLAHEIVHVLDRHHLRAIRKQAGLSGVMKLGMVAWQASQAGDGSGGSVDPEEVAMMKKVEESASELYARGLSREDELDADRKGMVIAARAGYDPWALVVVLQRIQSLKADNSALTSFFRTHPNTGDRIEAMEPILADSSLADMQGATLTERFHQHVD